MADEYNHLIDYVRYQDRTFDERPFGAADSMVLADLVYIRFEEVVRRPSLLSIPMSISSLTIAERLDLMLEGVNHADRRRELIHACAASRRFGDMRVNFAESRFSVERENQFAAVTFYPGDGSIFVAFRGTDNTITGWRENFNMAYNKSVPAQRDSVEYLDRVATITYQPIRVGGHSKGGNLAVYASTFCRKKVQDRIVDIFSLDGPGFKRDITQDGEFLRIKDRYRKLMPTGTLVGTLLSEGSDYLVVESDGEGFAQHELSNWRFDGEELVYAEKLSDEALRFDRMLDSWVGMLSDEQLEGTVETIFGLIREMEAGSFDDVMRILESGELSAVKAYRMIEPEKRTQAAAVIAALGRAYVASLRRPKEAAPTDDAAGE